MSLLTDTAGMRNRLAKWKRPEKARVHGRAGGAASVARRPFTRWWNTTSWLGRLAWFTVTAGIGGVLGVASTGSASGFLVGAGAGAGVATIVSVLLLVPGAVATTLVILVAASSMPFVATGYVTAASLTSDPAGAGFVDVAGASVSLFIAYALAMFIGLRWGRGRSWVSAVWVSVGLVFPGVVVLWVFPEWGLNAARVSLVVMVAVRCGAAGWIVAAFTWLVDRVRFGKDAEKWSVDASVDPVDVSAAWQRTAEGQKATGADLAGLPCGYAVFHDVRVRKSNWHIDHVVVGPTGVSVVANVQAAGDVVVDPLLGVQVPGADLGAEAWALFNAAEPVRKTLGLHPRDIHLFIVLHNSQASRMRVGVVDPSLGSRPVAEVVALPVGGLAQEIEAEFTWWSEVKVRQVRRRARMKLGSAVLPIASPRSRQRVHVSPVDLDGNLTVPAPHGYDSGVDEQMTLMVGDAVVVDTNAGSLEGLEAASEPFIDSHGVPVVRIRARDGAGVRGVRGRSRSRKGEVFPLASVRKEGVS